MRICNISGFIILLVILYCLISCLEKKNSIPETNSHLLKLYKIKFYEAFGHDAVNSINAEFIIINNSDTCIDNIKDVNKLNFVFPILECKLKVIEYCSKGTFDINTQIDPGDTAFYKLTYHFASESISNFYLILENPEKYLDIYNQRGYSEGPIRIVVHPYMKLYHSTDFTQNRKYPLPFHEEIEYDETLNYKTSYELLRFKYDTFYNK